MSPPTTAAMLKRSPRYWSDSGEWISPSGQRFQGKQAIEKELRTIFAENKGVRIEVLRPVDSPRVARGGHRGGHGSRPASRRAAERVHVPRCRREEETANGSWTLYVRPTFPRQQPSRLRPLRIWLGWWVSGRMRPQRRTARPL